MVRDPSAANPSGHKTPLQLIGVVDEKMELILVVDEKMELGKWDLPAPFFPEIGALDSASRVVLRVFFIFLSLKKSVTLSWCRWDVFSLSTFGVNKTLL